MDDCKLLVGAGTYTKPHANLVFVDGKKVLSIMGAADEANYRYNTCQRCWSRSTRTMIGCYIKFIIEIVSSAKIDVAASNVAL
jgi:hypothetical protein